MNNFIPSKNKTETLFTIIIPLIHIIISLVYELLNIRGFFEIQESLKPVRDIGFSLLSEKIILFSVCKIAGIILIFLIWYYIYTLIKRKDYLVLIPLIIFSLIGLLLYPECFYGETDNAIAYMMAIDYYPEYWQSVFIQIFYNACLMVFRHPLSIIFIQSALYVTGVYEAIYTLKSNKCGKLSYLPVIYYFLPENVSICYNPYRNNIFAILCIWFFTSLYKIYLVKQHDKINVSRVFPLLLLGALLSVMRGEGIVLTVAVLGIIFYFASNRLSIFTDGHTPKHPRFCGFVLLLATYTLLTVLIRFPQSIGEKKYYGKDYSIVNHMDILSYILRDDNKNTYYLEAENDLKIINNLTPIDAIREYGLVGFRNNNYSKNQTVNQTFLSSDKQKDLLHSIKRLETHNLNTVLFIRLRWFIIANRNPSSLNDNGALPLLSDTETNYATPYMEQVLIGIRTLGESKYTASWMTNKNISSIRTFLNSVLLTWFYICTKYGIIWILHILSLICLIIFDIQIFVKGNLVNDYPLHCASLSILGLWAAIFLGAPEMRYEYYYAVYYSSIIWNIIMFTII